MLLKHLQLTNFRSYSQKEFSFSPEVTVIVGSNASGKTNLLEAIYLLSTGRSFRAGVEREMIREGEEVARVTGLLAASDELTKEPSGMSFSGSAAPRFQGGFVSTNTLRSNKSNSGLDLLALRKSPLRSLSLLEKKRLEAILTTGSVLGKKTPYKKLLVNGVGKRFSDFVGNLPAVLFWPEDLELVTDSPSLRRRYLDNVLSLADREYRRASLAYEKALRVRNKILQGLKNAQNDYAAVHQVLAREGEMDYWEKVLVESGEVITKKREEYLYFINKFQIPNSKFQTISKSKIQISKQIPSQNIKFQIEYKKSEISYDRLGEYRVREVAAGMTLVGPHRDDFVVTQYQKSNIKNQNYNSKFKNISVYGSRGEQRLGVLWLKLGEMEFVTKKMALRPILLLDDIFSELDEEHRRLVMNIIPKQQTIITTTDLKVIEKGFLKEGEVIKIG